MVESIVIWEQPEPTDRDEVIERVRRGKMTPQDADKWAAEKGQPPFSGPRKSFDPMDDVFWTLPMTAAWIIWRKSDRVQNICRGRIESSKWIFHKWRMLNQQTGLVEEVLGFESESEDDFAISDVWLLSLRSDHLERAMNEVDAREDLRRKLQTGQLVATGLNQKGGRVAIPSIEWLDLRLDQDERPVDSVFIRGSREAAYECVMVARDDVISIWQGLQGEPVGLLASDYRSGAQGRPTSQQLVLAEFQRRAANGETASGLSEEGKILEAWLKRTHPRAPSMKHTTIENKIRHQLRTFRGPQK